MKPNWKEIAASQGYKSLKAAMIKDVMEASNHKKERGWSMREKEVYHQHFAWVINRAKHYAHHQKRTVSEVLTEWEKERSYWWLNYYQDFRQPLLKPSKRRICKLSARRENATDITRVAPC
ncbi:MAG: hypothetical protein R3F02_18555 [Thiolinea sp.]